MSRSTVDLRRTLVLNAPVALLWPLVSDTSRVNRLIGLPASERIEPGENMVQIVHSHYFGVPVAWREYPFEWVFEQWFENERVFLGPMPVERIMTSTALTPLDDQRTQVSVGVRLVNRNVAGWAAARAIVGQQMMRDLVRVYRLLETTARAASQVVPPPPRPPRVHEDRLTSSLKQLGRYDVRSALTELLKAHLRQADDMDVLKMRPFVLADQWGADRMEVLRMCLYATRSGLLDLEWDVLCPSCRGPNKRVSSLSDLASDVHCPACNIRYDLNFDEAVELRFSVSPNIREAIDVSYCIGGPANTRHILAQVRVPAKSVRPVQLRISEGEYRIRWQQMNERVPFQVRADASQQDLHLAIGSDVALLDYNEIQPGVRTLTFHNTTDEDVLVILEEKSWSSEAASAALVTALSEFRLLFSSEVLSPGMGLAVRNLTFLFSDLQGSTRMYEALGDAPAYARVRDHFTVLRSILAAHHGALVKTIGDAVMAVFPSAEDAFEAAVAIQHKFIEDEIAQGRPALRVKLGLHCGPCIAVNANDVLDYFGTTVNIAARVQSESLGGDIVLTADVLNDAGVRRAQERHQLEAKSFERNLKGISQSQLLYRISLDGALNKGEVATVLAFPVLNHQP